MNGRRVLMANNHGRLLADKSRILLMLNHGYGRRLLTISKMIRGQLMLVFLEKKMSYCINTEVGVATET